MPYGGAILNYDRLTAKADAGVHLDARVHKDNLHEKCAGSF